MIDGFIALYIVMLAAFTGYEVIAVDNQPLPMVGWSSTGRTKYLPARY